jgi:hypothetical protein
MNTIKKLMGIVWMLLGPAAMFFLINTALKEVAKNPVIDSKIQWGIFIIIFLPIACSLVIFGYYAYKGEYNSLPSSTQ